jgi:hypothetical protein
VIPFCPTLRTSLIYPALPAKTGDEIDLILELNGKIIAVECKASTAPQPTKGFYRALEVLKPDVTLIIAPLTTMGYSISDTVHVCSLPEVLETLSKLR